MTPAVARLRASRQLRDADPEAWSAALERHAGDAIEAERAFVADRKAAYDRLVQSLASDAARRLSA